jgi:hypothetical protein
MDDVGVSRDEDLHFENGEPTDSVTFGSSRPHWRQRSRWLRYIVAGFIAAVLVAVVVAAVRNGGTPSAAQPTNVATLPTSRSTTASAVPSRPVLVTQLGHQVLGVTAGWELFARGSGGLSGPPGELVRIQLAKGRLTSTSIPALLSTGPVSFLVQPERVIIRPLDLVPGYVVPDGHPADQLSGVLSRGGPAFPGPKPGQVWVETGTGDLAAMTLVGSDGGATGVTIPIPSGSYVTSDGAGCPLFTGTDGAYDARPNGLYRITTGTVLALGPTRWLTVECDDQDRCENVVIDRGSGKRRILRGPVLHLTPHAGVISPDGSTAAVAGQATLHLLDLKRGTDHRLAVPIDEGAAFDNETAAWSPESRWLFVAGPSGKLLVIDTHTDRVHHLGPALPPITQVAVRRAAHLARHAFRSAYVGRRE